MGSRLDLHAILTGFSGVEEAYFQPPEDLKLVYPCIIYKRISENVKFADNSPYFKMKQYRVTVLDYDPDSEIPDLVGTLPLSTYETGYVSNNINHSAYKLFY